MKLRIALAFGLSIFAVAAQAEQIVLTSATLIDPARNEVRDPSTNTDVNIDGDRIAGIGQKIRPALARVIDCKGKFILPGYIDTHVHFFQSGDLFTRPDVVDLTKVRPYADEVAWIKKNLPDTFERYLRSGITSVVDVGGAQDRERDCESAASCSSRAIDLKRVASTTRSGRSAHRQDRHSGSSPRIRAQARPAKSRSREDLVYR